MMEERLLRVGMVGLGRWGQRIVATLQALPRVEIAWIVPGQSAEAHNRCPAQVPLARDLRSALAGPEADVVVIATPPAAHAELALETLSHGLPVFIEKPLALDESQAYAVLTAAEARGLPLLIDHIHLFSPAYQWLKARLPERQFLRGVQAEAGNHGPWRRDYGVLFDWGPHDLALAVDVFGPDLCLTRAARIAREKRSDGGQAESLELNLASPVGQSITLNLSNCLNEKRRSFRLLGAEEDYLYAQGSDAATAQVLPHAGTGRAMGYADAPSLSPLANALTAFLAAVRRGQAPDEWNKLARAVTRLLAEAEQQLRG